MAKYTPMMEQYLEIKKQNQDCILFYRLGDFYEMFFEDAIIASKELEITLTGKNCGQDERAPMCGVPYHACDTYLNQLIEKGYKVGICEQVEDPKSVKGIVKREVVPTPSPGIIPLPAPVRVRISSISTPNCSAEHSSLMVYQATAHCTLEEAFTPTDRSSNPSLSPVTARSCVTVPPAEFPHTANRSGSRFSFSAMTLIAVVFPLPLGPRRPITLPLPMLRFTLSRASFPPNALLTS